MRLKRTSKNETEITVSDWTILFSYDTPVAAYDSVNDQYYETNTKYSRTTTKHINSFVGGEPTIKIDQSVIDGLAKLGD